MSHMFDKFHRSVRSIRATSNVRIIDSATKYVICVQSNTDKTHEQAANKDFALTMINDRNPWILRCYCRILIILQLTQLHWALTF